MQRKSKRVLASAVLPSVLAFGCFAAVAQADSTVFDTESSSVAYIHTEDTSAPNPISTEVDVSGSQITTIAPAIGAHSTGTTLADTMTVINPQTSKTSSTFGAASILETTAANGNSIGLGLGRGAGVTQSNGANLFQGPSETDISVNLSWDVGSAGFPARGFLDSINYQFNLGGTVGINGKDEFVVALQYFDVQPDSDSEPTLIGSLNIDQAFPGGATSTAFTKSVSGTVLLNNGIKIAANDVISIEGDIVFLAKNDDSPSDMTIQDDASGVVAGIPVAPLPSSGMVVVVGIGLMGAYRAKKCVG